MGGLLSGGGESGGGGEGESSGQHGHTLDQLQ